MIELDHVIIAVSDLEAAAARFSRILGRPPALRSRHPRGTANALFLFPSGPYLELLARWDAPERGTSAAALDQRLRERGDGLHGFALSTDDLDAAVARLRALGLEVAEPQQNTGTDDQGRLREWRAIRLPPPDDAGYLIQHLDLGWRRTLLPLPLAGREGSAAVALHHIAFDVADATTVSSAWEERYGLALTGTILSERLGARVLIHQAGAATVEFVGATRRDGIVAERIARRGYGLVGLAVEVRALDEAIAALRAAGVAIGDPEGGVLPASRVARLDPQAAHGVAVQLLHFDAAP